MAGEVAIMSGLGQQAVRTESVILIAELRNFTRMSEMLDAERVLGQVDRFFELAARCVQANSGLTMATHNDSLVASFYDGGPKDMGRNAVRAAQQLFGEFDTLALEWERDFGLRTAMALGVHRGEAVYGEAGPKGERRQVVFGDCVSIAERLVHRARAGELVLSDTRMSVLSLEELEMDPEPLPALELHHRPAMRIYGVLRDERLDFTST
jgi:class 3 adenylate cyclase